MDVSIDADRVINQPYTVIDEVFAATHAVQDARARAEAVAERVSSTFAHALQTEEALNKIPVLDGSTWKRGKIAPGTLVRFRGMIQDTFDPTLHPCTCSGKAQDGVAAERTLLYRDMVPSEFASLSKHLLDKETLLVIPVPGQASWCASSAPSTVPAAAAFSRVGASSEAPGSDATSTGVGAGQASSVTDGQRREKAVAEALAGMVHPIAPADSLPAVVHLYCTRDERDYGARHWRVGMHVEILGIYTLDAEDGEDSTDHGAEEDAEMATDEGVPGSSPAKSRRRITGHSQGEGQGHKEGAAAGKGGDARGAPMTEGQLLDEMSWAADQAHNPPSSLAVRLHAILMRQVSLGEPTLPVAQAQVGPHRPFAFHSPARGYVTIPAPAPATAVSKSKEMEMEAMRAAIAVRTGQGMAAASTLQQVAAALGAIPGLIAAPTPLPAGSAIAFLRDGIVGVLSACLGGDRLAGELTLLWALGGTTTYGRMDSLDTPLGRLSLCLVGLPATPTVTRMAAGYTAPPASRAQTPAQEAAPLPMEAYDPPTPVRAGASVGAQRLAAVLESMVPALACLPLRLDVLNGRRWAPIQDHETERILPGLLQLAPGTLCITDETVLSEGRLEEQGIKAIDAIQSVTGGGELPYDFGFGNISRFPVDTPVLSLCPPSTSGKGLLRTDLSLPLIPAAQEALKAGLPGVSAEQLSFPPALLGHIRQYFAAARCLPYRLCEPGSQQGTDVPDELVRMFSTFQGDKQEAMGRVLLLARLACLSFGESTLSPSRWAWVKDLENSRLARLPLPAQATAARATGQVPQAAPPITPERPGQRS